MSASATFTVRELLRATDDRDWPRVLELMADDSVTRNSVGRIYMGHAGVDDWRQDNDAANASRHFDAVEVRDLGGGYVLVVGAEHHEPRRGGPVAMPGAWIYHVRGGRVKACLYFRTEGEAIGSLTGPGRGERTVEIVERWVTAFNRDDLDALLTELDEELRFRPVLVDGEIIEGIDRFIDALVKLRVHYDDVLIEEVEVDEIGEGYAIATTTVRAVDDEDVAWRHLAHAVRIRKGRIAEWLSFERVEAARLAIPFGRSVAPVKHQAR
jgi:ketosteroid isomerase-like protein